MRKQPPVTLTIAGSDSGGGAGIQADLKTFQAFGCFGTTAITAITCQNTTGVSAVQGIDPEIVAGQIRDVLDDFPVAAAKSGMLFSAEIIKAIAQVWRDQARNIPLVIDPVMVSASGHRLLQVDAENELRNFMQYATLITPNLPEAGVLLGRDIQNLVQMQEAARALVNLVGTPVLLKGGHRLADARRNDEAIDLYCDGKDIQELVRPVLDARNTHGTGCTLSAAIAAGLARGQEPLEAIEKARDYLHGAMDRAPNLGAGSGPLNHMWRDQAI